MHAGDLGLRERFEQRPEQLLGQIEADPRRDDGEPVERLAALRAEPPHARQHGLHHADRHGIARRRQRLRHEERVPAGDAVQRLRRRPRCPRTAAAPPRTRAARAPGAAPGEPTSIPRNRWSGCWASISSSRKVSTSAAPQALDPARRVRQHVERGVVRPVDVLDDEDGRRLGRELLQQRGEHAVDGLLVGQRGGERAALPAAASRSGPSVRGAIRSSHADSRTRALSPACSRTRAPGSSCRFPPRPPRAPPSRGPRRRSRTARVSAPSVSPRSQQRR